ncbi:VOC family protein [Gaiella sp.]|uniref:VOC family protein n=1 Tax=Gaiella sp. TaxID=2663207 RepID=UPI00398306FF
MTIDPTTSIGSVELTVGDLEVQASFYCDGIGLRELRRTDDTVELGAAQDGATLVTLVHRPDAPVRPARTTGLFHLALLVPGRAELARAVHRVRTAGWRFTGASDHLVSEALYLDDPEGNGIEIYCDRPREEWESDNGELRMGTLPLDLAGVLAGVEDGDAGDGMVSGTRIGHVHLQVADLPGAEAFYVETLGFDVTVRAYPGALFVSAGGYHHHLGLNTWAAVGAPAPPAGARGLRSFSVVLSDQNELDAVWRSLAEAGYDGCDERTSVTDPSGNRLVLTTI